MKIDSSFNFLNKNEVSFYPKKKNKILKFFLVLLFFCFIFYYFFILAPAIFLNPQTIRIKNGDSLGEVAQNLQENKVIRSKVFFQSLVIFFGGEKKIAAGDYYFFKKENVFQVVNRLIKNFFGIQQFKITFPEGFSLKEMALLLAEKLDNFDQEKFLNLTKGDEGYLFPDTYFLTKEEGVENIITKMKDNFIKKVSSLAENPEYSRENENILVNKDRLKEIITMASIIEKEASKDEERSIISGILWKRIQIKMALQVDATFIYINGKASSELTKDDLKIDSLYNTYRYKGLPPTPINNPGLKSIKAAINPEKTNYLFYLHDKDGNIHYAETFEEHIKNKRLYLN